VWAAGCGQHAGPRWHNAGLTDVPPDGDGDRALFESALREAMASDEIVRGCDESPLALAELARTAVGHEREILTAAASERARLDELVETRRGRIAAIRDRVQGSGPASPLARLSGRRQRVAGAVAAATVLAGAVTLARVSPTDSVAFAAAAAVLVLGALFLAYLGLAWLVRLARLHVVGPLAERRAAGLPEVRELDALISGARAELRRAVRERGVLPHLREQLNASREHSYETRLAIGEDAAPGLKRLPDLLFEMPTDALVRVRGLMRRMGSGSIGVSGPRGVGKTTLLRLLCSGRFGALAGPPMIAVLVAAPVEYAAREFLLYLFAEVCRALIGPGSDRLEAAAVRRRPGLEGPLLDLLRSTILAAVVVAGVMGAALTIGDVAPGLRVGWAGAGSAGGIAAGLLLVARASLSLLRPDGSPPVWVQTAGPGVLCLVGGVALLPVLRPLTFAALPGVVLVALSVAGALLLSLVSRRSSTPTPASELRTLAARHLARIRYQQTYTSGWSGGLRLPSGPEASLTGELSMAEVQRTLPELAGDFRRFVDQVARSGRTVVIGIDELDKIASAERAGQFMNDLKAVFGIPGTFFLVSVSEDAMASFERRGMPFRDVFDSSFDEIVTVGHLRFEDARRLMNRRVIGLPTAFLGLVFAVSGGLPREFIRATRAMLDVPARTLHAVAGELLEADLRSKTVALMYSAPRLSGDVHRLMEWCARRPGATSSPSELIDHAVDAGGLLVGDPAADARRMVLELATYEYFCATLLEVFVDDRDEEDWRRAESTGGSASLDGLAAARQAFAVSVDLAWTMVSECRGGWGLESQPAPVYVERGGG
jgi:hypothetical protein